MSKKLKVDELIDSLFKQMAADDAESRSANEARIRSLEADSAKLKLRVDENERYSRLDNLVWIPHSCR